MRRSHIRRAIIVLLGLSFTLAAHALEVGSEFWIGNLAFRTDRVVADTTLPGADYPWGISFFAGQQLADNIRFDGGFYSDPVLRNISYSLFSYTQNVLTVGVGPFFGFFNDWGVLLKPGISTALRVELPGVLFVTFRSDSSIGGLLIQVGDYLQEQNNLAVGFYVPNAICSVGLQTKKFTQVQATATVVDGLTDFYFSTDIFEKNMPYRAGVTFSYQSLSKSFVVSGVATSATINSIIVAPELVANIGAYGSFYSTLEASVYSFGQGLLIGKSTGDFLFRVTSGIRINTDAFFATPIQD